MVDLTSISIVTCIDPKVVLASVFVFPLGYAGSLNLAGVIITQGQ